MRLEVCPECCCRCAAAQDTSLGYGQGAIDLLDEWVDVSRGSKTACTVQPADMVAVAKLLDAIYESSREGKRVAVEV